MKFASPFQLNQAEVQAMMASLRLWLLDALSQLGLDHWLARELDAATRQVTHVIMLRALVEDGPIHRPRARARLHHAHRAQRHRSNFRAFAGGAFKGLHSGAPQERLARLRALLDAPEPTIARIVRRIRRVLPRVRATRLIHARPPMDRRRPRRPAPAYALAHADTS